MFRLYPSEMVWMDRTYFIVIDYYISFPSFFLSFFFFLVGGVAVYGTSCLWGLEACRQSRRPSSPRDGSDETISIPPGLHSTKQSWDGPSTRGIQDLLPLCHDK